MFEFWDSIIKPILDAIDAVIIVEIGAFNGKNTVKLLNYCAGTKKHLHVIDPTPLFDVKQYHQKFGNCFTLHEDISVNVLPKIGKCDAVLIDGDHNWYTVFNELKALEKIHQDDTLTYPIILLHDIGWPYGRRDLYYHPDRIPAIDRHPYRRGGLLNNQSELEPFIGLNPHLCHAIYEYGEKNGVLTAIEDFSSQSQIDFEFIKLPAYFGLGILFTTKRRHNGPKLHACLNDVVGVKGLMRLLTHLEEIRLKELVQSQSHPECETFLGATFPPRKGRELKLHEQKPSETCSREKPKLSIIVVLYNMRREAERTLFSLSAQYQQDVNENDYEVIVIENGSTESLEFDDLSRFGSNFRYHLLCNAPKSPVFAINEGVKLAKAEKIGIMIDGAHILTPGVLKYALMTFALYPSAVLGVRYCFLGPGQQNETIFNGYTQHIEDTLLQKIEWHKNGYRLFDIGELMNRPQWGWFHPLCESNCLFVSRDLFSSLGGYEEKFDLPGGGYANTDFYIRAVMHQESQPVVLLGEATFHQLHGGITTNVSIRQLDMLRKKYLQQYRLIRGRELKIPRIAAEYVGHMPSQAMLSFNMLRDREYDMLLKEIHAKEREIQNLASICAEREALINELSHIGTGYKRAIKLLLAKMYSVFR